MGAGTVRLVSSPFGASLRRNGRNKVAQKRMQQKDAIAILKHRQERLERRANSSVTEERPELPLLVRDKEERAKASADPKAGANVIVQHAKEHIRHLRMEVRRTRRAPRTSGQTKGLPFSAFSFPPVLQEGSSGICP